MRRGFAAWAFVLAACSSSPDATADNVVQIVGTDYAFHAPTDLPAGRTTFRFANHGKVEHELNISRLKPGVSIDKLLETIRAHESVKDLIDGPVGVLFAAPGDTSNAGLTADLAAGQTYAVICIFTDSAGAKPHHDLGMYKVITVNDTKPARSAPVATDTIIATDYAFQYERMVSPGIHTFVMRNDGKQRHQVSIVLMKKGVTLERLLEVEKAGGDVEALIDGDLGLLHARAGQTPLGGLTIEMLPGREYGLACFFQDDPRSPPHVALGMVGSITVSEGSYLKQDE